MAIRPVVETKTFSAGYLPGTRPTDGRDGLSSLSNVWFDWDSEAPTEKGAITSFPEVISTDETALPGGGEVVYMYRSENKVGDILRIAYLDDGVNCSIREVDEDGVVGSQLRGGLTTGTLLGCCTATDPDGDVFIFCCNGSNPPFKLEVATGTWTAIGLDRADGSNVTVSKIAGDGNVAGIVKYWISEVSSGVEGALSDEFGETDTGQNPDNIRLRFNHADYFNRDFRIYRTYADGVDPFLVGTVEVGAGSTDFDDDVPDDELGNPPFTHGDVPPNETIDFLSYFDRVYALTPTELYWSDVGQPESFFTASNGNFLRVGFGDGDSAVALARAGDSILVFEKNHLYQLLGRIPEEYNFKEILPSDGPTRSIGTVDHRSVTYTPFGIMFYWKFGVYRFFNGQISLLSEPVSSELTRVSSSPTAALVYSPLFSRLFVSQNQTDAGTTLFFDIPTRSWVGTRYTGWTCYLVDDDTDGYEVLRFGGERSSGKNHIGYFSDDTFEDTSASFKTLAFGAGDSRAKRFLYVDVILGGNFDSSMTALLSIDGQQFSPSTPVTFSSDTRKRQMIRISLQGAIGRIFHFELLFSASDNQEPYRIYEVATTYQNLGNQYNF